MDVGGKERGRRLTKFHDSFVSLRLFRSSGSPVVMALMDPVTAIAFTFLPYLAADLSS